MAGKDNSSAREVIPCPWKQVGEGSSRLEILDLVHEDGSFCQTYRCRETTTNVLYLLKRTHLAELQQSDVDYRTREVDILKQLQHPHILRCHAGWTAGNVWHVLSEDATCSVHQLVLDKGTAPPPALYLKWLYQLASALKYLHEDLDKPILHRNLKPSNIMLHPALHYHLIIADFGLSKQLTSRGDYAYSVLGTAIIMSPEIVNNVKYNSKTDMWSLGICAVFIATLHNAVNARTFESLFRHTRLGKIQGIAGLYSVDIEMVVDSLLQVDPNLRPSASQLLSTLRHSFPGCHTAPICDSYPARPHVPQTHTGRTRSPAAVTGLSSHGRGGNHKTGEHQSPSASDFSPPSREVNPCSHAPLDTPPARGPKVTESSPLSAVKTSTHAPSSGRTSERQPTVPGAKTGGASQRTQSSRKCDETKQASGKLSARESPRHSQAAERYAERAVEPSTHDQTAVSVESLSTTILVLRLKTRTRQGQTRAAATIQFRATRRTGLGHGSSPDRQKRGRLVHERDQEKRRPQSGLTQSCGSDDKLRGESKSKSKSQPTRGRRSSDSQCLNTAQYSRPLSGIRLPPIASSSQQTAGDGKQIPARQSTTRDEDSLRPEPNPVPDLTDLHLSSADRAGQDPMLNTFPGAFNVERNLQVFQGQGEEERLGGGMARAFSEADARYLTQHRDEGEEEEEEEAEEDNKEKEVEVDMQGPMENWPLSLQEYWTTAQRLLSMLGLHLTFTAIKYAKLFAKEEVQMWLQQEAGVEGAACMDDILTIIRLDQQLDSDTLLQCHKSLLLQPGPEHQST